MPMHYPKTREEWLALRHQYVSSTESAALFGLSAYCTPYELGIQKQAKDPPSDDAFSDNERVIWGLRLQEAIAKGISEDYGVKIRRVRGYAVHSACRLGASFDYEIIGVKQEPVRMDPEKLVDVTVQDPCLQEMYRDLGPGVLEIKNVDWLIFKKEWKKEEGEIEAPAHIEIQVQHQLEAIQTRKWAAVGVLIGGNDTVLVLRDYDPEFGKQIVNKVNTFFANLEKGVLPPVTLPQDVDIIRKIYLASSPGKIFDGNEDVELLSLCEQYSHASSSAKGFEEARKSLGAKILMHISDAAIATTKGFKISAGTVAETVVPSFKKDAYRNLRVTRLKQKEE